MKLCKFLDQIKHVLRFPILSSFVGCLIGAACSVYMGSSLIFFRLRVDLMVLL